jgi:hypothetical protein
VPRLAALTRHPGSRSDPSIKEDIAVRLTIYHNVARDGHGRHTGFDGYLPGQPLVPVFAYDVELVDGGMPELLLLAEQAFEAFNADPVLLAGRQRDLATQYRNLRLRSLSVGDVVRAGETTLACENFGFREVPGELNEVRISEHGTHPFEAR